MKNIINKGLQKFEIIPCHKSHENGELVKLQDKIAAHSFLRGFSHDYFNMMTFRDLLKDDVSFHNSINRLNDYEVIDQIAWQLLSGVIKIAKLPIEKQVWSDEIKFYEKDDYESPVAATTHQDISWITLKVVDASTGMPVPDVKLSITLPNGSQQDKTTDKNGTIDIFDLDDGDCEIFTDIKDATIEDTLAFVNCGRVLRTNSSGQRDVGNEKISGSFIAEINEHKIKTGETPESLAKSIGMTWAELARFNWGTSSPEEIEEHLIDDVGCTKKDPNGNGFIFDDTDDPGIIYLPKPLKQGNLTTQGTHYISVKQLEPIRAVQEYLFSM